MKIQGGGDTEQHFVGDCCFLAAAFESHFLSFFSNELLSLVTIKCTIRNGVQHKKVLPFFYSACLKYIFLFPEKESI